MYSKTKGFLLIDVETKNLNMLVPWYLMCSFAYYEMSVSIISDYDYDALCGKLADNFESIEHMHKELVDLDALRAGTGYDIVYPARVQHAAIDYINRFVN